MTLTERVEELEAQTEGLELIIEELQRRIVSLERRMKRREAASLVEKPAPAASNMPPWLSEDKDD